jgi:hypothetical protein
VEAAFRGQPATLRSAPDSISNTPRAYRLPKNYGTGIRTRQKKALDAALRDEGLPITSTAAPGEQRVISELGLEDFAQRLQQPERRARKSNGGRLTGT